VNILITGGTGYIDSHIALCLIEAGLDVAYKLMYWKTKRSIESTFESAWKFKESHSA
jgi:hypothetical protein